MSSPKPKPSRRPQQIIPGVWYYENKSSIDVYVEDPGKRAMSFRILSRKLIATLKRQGKI